MSTTEAYDGTQTTTPDTGLVTSLAVMVGIGAWVLGMLMAVPALETTTGWESLIAGGAAMGWATLPALVWVLHALPLKPSIVWAAGGLFIVIALVHPVIAQHVAVTWVPLALAVLLGVVAAGCIAAIVAAIARR